MSFHVELHPTGLPGTGQKVCGGWVVCKPILLFTFNFDQAEQGLGKTDPIGTQNPTIQN